MPRTTASLLERSLQIVDQVGSGQVATAEDTEFARDALTSLLAELVTRNICDVSFNPSDLGVEIIPDNLFNPLAALLAADLKTTFVGGIVSDAEREGLVSRVRRVTALGASYEVLPVDYF